MTDKDTIDALFGSATRYNVSQRYALGAERVQHIPPYLFDLLDESGKLPFIINAFLRTPHRVSQRVVDQGFGPYYFALQAEHDVCRLIEHRSFGNFNVIAASERFNRNIWNFGEWVIRCRHGHRQKVTGIQLLTGTVPVCPYRVDSSTTEIPCTCLAGVRVGTLTIIGIDRVDTHNHQYLRVACTHCHHTGIMRRDHYFRGDRLQCPTGCTPEPHANSALALSVHEKVFESIVQPLLESHPGRANEAPFALTEAVQMPDGSTRYRYLKSKPAAPVVKFETSQDSNQSHDVPVVKPEPNGTAYEDDDDAN